MTEGAEQLHARDLEVGEVVAVVDDAGGVGLGVAHAHVRREPGGWRLGRTHRPECSTRPGVARNAEGRGAEAPRPSGDCL